MSSLLHKHSVHISEVTDSQMLKIQGTQIAVMSCIKLLGKNTVRNNIPFVTVAGAGLGTTGVGAATGRMVGDLLVEND